MCGLIRYATNNYYSLLKPFTYTLRADISAYSAPDRSGIATTSMMSNFLPSGDLLIFIFS